MLVKSGKKFAIKDRLWNTPKFNGKSVASSIAKETVKEDLWRAKKGADEASEIREEGGRKTDG